MTRRTYKCKCGTIEVRQCISEPPLKKCEKCNEPYRQVYHSPTFVNLIGFEELSRRNAAEIMKEGV